MFTKMLIIVPFQVCSITDELQPFQSGSVFYESARLTSAPYDHVVIITVDGLITWLFKCHFSSELMEARLFHIIEISLQFEY